MDESLQEGVTRASCDLPPAKKRKISVKKIDANS